MDLERGPRTGDGGPPVGPDHDLTLSDGPHATGIVDRILDGPVPLPVVEVGRVALSPADGHLQSSDENTDGCITTGFQCWNTDSDIQDQYETFNGMPVYYGSDLYNSEDSDWDDPFARASAAYVEDYNFDVPEGMDLMVNRHGRIPDSLDVQQDCQMDVAPVYHTVSYATRDEWDTSDKDSLTATADEDDPYMDDFYQQVVLSDDENCFDSDDGSVTNFDGSMSEGEYYVVSDDGSMADLDWDILENADYGNSDIWSVTDISSCGSDVEVEDDCDLYIIYVAHSDLNIYHRRLCLLCPDGTADLRNLRGRSVDDHRMDHSRTVSWDPAIADSRTLSVCYDGLCLMTLFRTVMYLAHYWAMRIVWTGPDEGFGRSMAWMEPYLPRLYPPCVVDRVHEVTTEIKVPGCVIMIHVDGNNSGRRLVRVRGVSLVMNSAGRISLTLTGYSVSVWAVRLTVDC